MANRSYLYSLSNQPTAYADRPETISGLSEWPYGIPFSYRLLMSGNPQLCASLISDGFSGEPEGNKTRLYAISSDFETGFARLNKFFSILNTLVANEAPQLIAEIKEAIQFLEAHRDRYLLLETIELDTMTESEEAKLRTCVEDEINNCLLAGAAVDALPDNIIEAGDILKKASKQQINSQFDAFYGLRLDDDCDDARFDYPLGASQWSDILYFSLWNRAEFDANN